MKMFGNGVKTIENLVLVESNELHKRLDEQLGQAIDLHRDLGKSFGLLG